MGVRGAAAATVISQGISAAMGFVYIVRNYVQMRFRLEDLKATPELSGEMFVTGLSMAMMSTIYSIGSVILQSSINALGSVYIAAQVGGRRLVELFMMPGGALSSSCATFASQNFGAGKRGRIAKGVKAAFFMLSGLVDFCSVFCGFSCTSGSGADYRKPEQGCDCQCGFVYSRKHSHVSAYGFSCDYEKCSAGNAAQNCSAFMQQPGADWKGDFWILDCSGNGLSGSLCL